MTEDVAKQLEEMAKLLKAEGKDREAYNFTTTADALYRADAIPPNPADLDGVGPAMRDYITTLRVHGTHPRLEGLREKHPYFTELTKLDSVGPKRASCIHSETGATTIKEILEQGDDLTNVEGIGSKTASKILESASRQRLDTDRNRNV